MRAQYTLRQLKEAARAIGYTVRLLDGEYRLAPSMELLTRTVDVPTTLPPLTSHYAYLREMIESRAMYFGPTYGSDDSQEVMQSIERMATEMQSRQVRNPLTALATVKGEVDRRYAVSSALADAQGLKDLANLLHGQWIALRAKGEDTLEVRTFGVTVQLIIEGLALPHDVAEAFHARIFSVNVSDIAGL